MSELTKKEMKEIISEVMDEKTKAFYIDREKHWKHHDFLDKTIAFLDKTEGIVWRTIIIAFIMGALGIFILGIIFWGKTNFIK